MNSLRHVASARRLDNSGAISDSGTAAAGGGEASASGVENFVTEEHHPGFKLRVRFVTADCAWRADGGRLSASRASNSGPSTTRTTTSADTHADIQRRLTDRSVETF